MTQRGIYSVLSDAYFRTHKLVRPIVEVLQCILGSYSSKRVHFFSQTGIIKLLLIMVNSKNKIYMQFNFIRQVSEDSHNPTLIYDIIKL